MRILRNIVSGCFIVCCLTVSTKAGCPHCQAIVEVTVELDDGDIRHGYFEYHHDDLPSDTSKAGRVTIPLNLLPTAFYPDYAIRLLDTVVVVSGLGRFASLSNIDSIAVVDIEQMVFESQLTNFGAERIHFMSTEQIELLSSPELLRFDTTIDLSVIHYVSLNNTVTEEDLKHLARNRGLVGGPQDHLLNHLIIQLRYMDQVDDSLFKGQLIWLLESKYANLITMQKGLDSLVSSDIIGRHFIVVSSYVNQWTDFIYILLGYLRDNDRQPLENAILNYRKDDGLPNDIDKHPYEHNGSVDRDGITYLIKSYVERHQLSNKLGKDYFLQLNTHGVFVFSQAFD